MRDGKETFLSDRKTQDAEIRNLEVIGQAVKDLGSDTLSTQSAIPWKQIAGTRDILAHQYLGVDIKLVWNIVEKQLPKLEKAVRDIVKRERIDLD